MNKVEETLRGIVQDAINESLSKFPTLKQAVEAKVMNKIFDTKRDQTIEFIKQFLEMQKMSTDVVFAPVPLPSELVVWDATLVTNSITERTRHPSMISKTMNHMKHLSSKLYPYDVIRDIETTGTNGNYKVCSFSVNVSVFGSLFVCPRVTLIFTSSCSICSDLKSALMVRHSCSTE